MFKSRAEHSESILTCVQETHGFLVTQVLFPIYFFLYIPLYSRTFSFRFVHCIIYLQSIPYYNRLGRMFDYHPDLRVMKCSLLTSSFPCLPMSLLAGWCSLTFDLRSFKFLYKDQPLVCKEIVSLSR